MPYQQDVGLRASRKEKICQRMPKLLISCKCKLLCQLHLVYINPFLILVCIIWYISELPNPSIVPDPTGCGFYAPPMMTEFLTNPDKS